MTRRGKLKSWDDYDWQRTIDQKNALITPEDGWVPVRYRAKRNSTNYCKNTRGNHKFEVTRRRDYKCSMSFFNRYRACNHQYVCSECGKIKYFPNNLCPDLNEWEEGRTDADREADAEREAAWDKMWYY